MSAKETPAPTLTLAGHRAWDPVADPTGETMKGKSALVPRVPWTDHEATARAFGLMALRHDVRFVVMADPVADASLWFRQEPDRGFLSESICALIITEPEMLAADPLDARRMKAIAKRGWPLPNVVLAAMIETGDDACAVTQALIEIEAAARLIAIPASGFVGDLLPWHLAKGWTCRWTARGPRRHMGAIIGI